MDEPHRMSFSTSKHRGLQTKIELELDVVKPICLSVLLLYAVATTSIGSADVLFEDVSPAGGIDYVGASWGLGWRDFNGDTYPDTWLGNHRNGSSLFVNDGDGSFSIYFQPLDRTRDTHGIAWADLDNDGDSDLIELVGGRFGQGVGPNRLFINYNGQFTNEAEIRNVDYPYGRGRFGLWFDYDHDSLLDVFLINEKRDDGMGPTALFANRGTVFNDVTLQVGLGGTNINGALVGDFSGDRKFDVLAFRDQDSPLQLVYRLNSQRFHVMNPSPLPVNDLSHVVSAVVSDFNGDQQADIFTLRSREFPDLAQVSDQTVNLAVPFNRNTMAGMEFEAIGDVTFELSLPAVWDTSHVFIGASGSSPTSQTFTLSASNSQTHGLQSPRTEEGIYIGYTDGSWTLLLEGRENGGLFYSRASANDIANSTPIGFGETVPLTDILLLSDDTGSYRDATVQSMLNHGEWCRYAAPGDFDNDMDIDLYLVCSESAANIDNMLFLNNGDGTFERITTHGAEGVGSGRGDAVAMADFDRDGFLDLLVSNGLWRLFEGPTQLFRNLGNSNHWIEINLLGTESNRDGVGARVEATAGGITQLREQTGGERFAAQDDRILHFGLGPNTVVDHIAVFWPSGNVQQLFNVSGDQLLEIVEDTSNDDEDIDGMPDVWEYTHNLDPLDPSDRDLDPDGDGLTNIREFELGTDPNAAGADEIRHIDAPLMIPPTGTVPVTIEYLIPQSRDILLSLKALDGSWWGGRVIVSNVAPGSGEVPIDFPIRFNPPVNVDLVWTVRVLPLGQDWGQSVVQQTLSPVVVGDVDEIRHIDAPLMIPPTGTVPVTIEYLIPQSRDILLSLKALDGSWWGGRVIVSNVAPGSGEVPIDFPIRFNPPVNVDLVWTVRVLPLGQDWGQSVVQQTLSPVVVE